VTDSTYTQQTEVPEVVVYVDQYGNDVSTTTETVVIVPGSTSAVASVKTLSTDLSPRPSAAGEVPAVSAADVSATPISAARMSPSGSSSAVPATPTTKTAVTSSSAPASAANQDSTVHGVTYSPYKGGGGCKSASEVDADFALFAEDFSIVRLYGVDCDQVAAAYAAAKKYGNKLFLGIYDITAVPQAVSTMAAGVNNDWSVVDTVSVGNELVNSGAASVGQVLAALSQARTALSAAGYTGPVVTVDTFVAAEHNPALCDQSDYCAVNVHPFFDPNTGPDQAGSFVTSTIATLRSKLSDPRKRIVVTETGWPWKGSANGAAVPGLDQQTAALTSIKGAFSSNPADCILFTAFNDLWKQAAPSTFYAEQFWGMGGRYSPADNQ
jgi:exo-beta-1,3-glucanase (GH17 family)